MPARTIKQKTKKTQKPAGPFGRMTRAQAIVAVARDVLKHLAAGKFKAAPGTFCTLTPAPGVRRDSLMTRADVRNGLDVKTVLEDRVQTCTVCAVGAAFVAGVLRFDRLPVTDNMAVWKASGLSSPAANTRFESDLFYPEDLQKMAQFFEGTGCGYSIMEFWDRCPAAADRLKSIMYNVAAHRGRFVPNDLPGVRPDKPKKKRTARRT